MSRRKRPPETTRSEHWLRVAVNERRERLNSKIGSIFGWADQSAVEWLSPIKDDDYAEYFDEAFLERLGLNNLRTPLKNFWPPSGPRWDGLAKTADGRIILVEAKAYVEESVDYGSQASTKSLERIKKSLSDAKNAYSASAAACWESPFYQYANRLAHLYFLHTLNDIDAYLLFIYFADAPDVPNPCTIEQWEGAARLTKKCLGLGAHRFQSRVGELFWDVANMLSNNS